MTTPGFQPVGYAPSGSGGITQLTGDVLAGPGSGSVASQVAQVNGTSVPAGGALTIGNVLQVTGVAALGYGPLNLAGGANFVIGVLPAGNVAALTLAGDVTGNTGASVVAKVNGATVPAGGALTIGNVLQVTAAGALGYGPLNLAGGVNFVIGVLPVANMTSSLANIPPGTAGQTLATNAGATSAVWSSILLLQPAAAVFSTAALFVYVNGTDGQTGNGALALNASGVLPTPGANSCALFSTSLAAVASVPKGSLGITDPTNNISVINSVLLSLNGTGTAFVQAGGVNTSLTVQPGPGSGGSNSSTIPGTLSLTTQSAVAATSGAANGAHGGDLPLATGNGAPGLSGSDTGGRGGDSIGTLGNGALGIGPGTSGRGGNWTRNAGNGAAASGGTGTSGNGGNCALNGGNGGAGVGASNNSNGGTCFIDAGAPGTGGSGTAGLWGGTRIQNNGVDVLGVGVNGVGFAPQNVSVAKVTPILTLTQPQYLNRVIKIVGTLTAAMTIALPNFIGEWIFDLTALLGAFTVGWTCGTSGSSATVLSPVAGNLGLVMVYCYGGNAVPSINA